MRGLGRVRSGPEKPSGCGFRATPGGNSFMADDKLSRRDVFALALRRKWMPADGTLGGTMVAGHAPRRRTMAGAIVGLTWLACSSALAQQAGGLLGAWGVRIPGYTFPIDIRIQLLPNGRFQQDMQSGADACGHSMQLGNYSLVQGPDTYHFVVVNQVPLVDCLGNRIQPQTGWTARLRVTSPTTLEWFDVETGNTLHMQRVQ